MSFAIDGNVVHGLANSGTAYIEASSASLIGQRASGFLKVSPNNRGYISTYQNDLSWGYATIDGKFSDTGTIIGVVRDPDNKTIYAAIQADTGGPVQTTENNDTYPVWFDVTKFKVGGVISPTIYRLTKLISYLWKKVRLWA